MRSQVRLKLLVLGPYFENQCLRLIKTPLWGLGSTPSNTLRHSRRERIPEQTGFRPCLREHTRTLGRTLLDSHLVVSAAEQTTNNLEEIEKNHVQTAESSGSREPWRRDSGGKWSRQVLTYDHWLGEVGGLYWTEEQHCSENEPRGQLYKLQSSIRLIICYPRQVLGLISRVGTGFPGIQVARWAGSDSPRRREVSVLGTAVFRAQVSTQPESRVTDKRSWQWGKGLRIFVHFMEHTSVSTDARWGLLTPPVLLPPLGTRLSPPPRFPDTRGYTQTSPVSASRYRNASPGLTSVKIE